MTWNPDGIVVGEKFADYVETLRETHDYASGGDNAHSTHMTQTHSGSYGGTV